ncbi:MAG TPA: YciI family protein [Myxococcota bacterium]|nr:YciI family protein [Myxococcota bacterium]
MEFVLLFVAPKGTPEPTPAGMAEMGKYAQELASRKILRRGAPLAREAAAATVRVRGGKPLVIDGPFAESKEVIAGFWVIDVPGRAAAIEIARRCPHARYAAVQVHRLVYRGAFDDAEAAPPFLLVFRMEPGLSDPDGSKGREMQVFGEGLLPTKTLIETGRLADQEAHVRVETRAKSCSSRTGPSRRRRR